MFALHDSRIPVPEDVTAVLTAAWQRICSTGTWWSGADRVAMARVARTVRSGQTKDGEGRSEAGIAQAGLSDVGLSDMGLSEVGLSKVGLSAVHMLAATPAHTTRAWVDEMLEELGVGPYVELVEVVSTVVGVDTTVRLLGATAEPFPAPEATEPRRTPVDAAADKGKAWVPMIGFQLPPNVLSAVPASQQATNDLLDVLYMTDGQMADPDITIRDLHRTQIEVVAAATSHRNECFY